VDVLSIASFVTSFGATPTISLSMMGVVVGFPRFMVVVIVVVVAITYGDDIDCASTMSLVPVSVSL
jgi:hypothetical protein